MRLLLLFLVPFVVLAGPEEFEAEKVRMKALLHRLYFSEEVTRYCRKNPDDFYAVEVAEGKHIEIDCRTRNAWVALVRRDE